MVELSSPTTQRHDRVRKMELYGKSGVAEYWLVTPHPFMVEVLRNVGGLYITERVYTERDILHSPAFPELRLELATIYANLPPQPEIDEVREASPPYAAEES
ncbi:MAG: Uma2 family endonuclease [Candidatus Eremiobacteraeota bacterium]|nr:Uma2 family endonuclease [Candidatus Eremiobacteraeota bacterium]MCW5868653.1 Uma2 family endonuclease [Candidatus Eremiobacteraeota bacterium]